MAGAKALQVVSAPDDEDVDISEFEAAAPERVNKCWFANRLTDEQQRKVTKAKRHGARYDTIHIVLVNWGVDAPSVSSMGHHFLGHCGCAK